MGQVATLDYNIVAPELFCYMSFTMQEIQEKRGLCQTHQSFLLDYTNRHSLSLIFSNALSLSSLPRVSLSLSLSLSLVITLLSTPLFPLRPLSFSYARLSLFLSIPSLLHSPLSTSLSLSQSVERTTPGEEVVGSNPL